MLAPTGWLLLLALPRQTSHTGETLITLLSRRRSIRLPTSSSLATLGASQVALSCSNLRMCTREESRMHHRMDHRMDHRMGSRMDHHLVRLRERSRSRSRVKWGG